MEKRHLRYWRASKEEIENVPSVILQRKEHQKITAELRKELLYGKDYRKEYIFNVYQDIYSNYPEYMREIETYLK